MVCSTVQSDSKPSSTARSQPELFLVDFPVVQRVVRILEGDVVPDVHQLDPHFIGHPKVTLLRSANRGESW